MTPTLKDYLTRSKEIMDGYHGTIGRLAWIEKDGNPRSVEATKLRYAFNEHARLVRIIEIQAEALARFADRDNPSEPKYVAWPKNEVMRDARKAESDVEALL